MSQKEPENKEMRITRLEEEIKEAKDQLERMIVEYGDQEKFKNCAAYMRYLEREMNELRNAK